MTEPRVVVVGDIMADVIAATRSPMAGDEVPATIVTRGGGSAANVACWLAADGTPTAYVGRVGDDAHGRAALADLRAYGVRPYAAVDPVRPTGTCVVLVSADGERSMLPDRGAGGALVPGDLPRYLFEPGRHLHLSGYVLLGDGSRGAGLAALGLAREAGMTVSVDPSSAGPLAAVGAERFLGWIGNDLVVLANAEEARVLTGETDAGRAADALAARCGEAVVTDGERGAHWRRPGAPPAYAAPEQVEVVDTTGAGDAFKAGYLRARLDGTGPEGALAAGCRLAASVVVRTGARPLPRMSRRHNIANQIRPV